jgi:hypothetical protein
LTRQTDEVIVEAAKQLQNNHENIGTVRRIADVLEKKNE